MYIRKMEESDIAQAEYICIQTAEKSLKENNRIKDETLLLYNKYYTRAELDNCFVLTDENNLAVGYIICAQNYIGYIKSFCRHELKALLHMGLKPFLKGCSCILCNIPFAKNYPAHMHIDILPQYQRKGYGTKLLSELINHLKSINSRGLMLIVDSNNHKAVQFYKKCGLQEINKSKTSIVMGIKL